MDEERRRAQKREERRRYRARYPEKRRAEKARARARKRGRPAPELTPEPIHEPVPESGYLESLQEEYSKPRLGVCQGTCSVLEVKVKAGRRQDNLYQRGAKRCTTCRIFMWVDAYYCPCCGHLLLTGKKYKYAERIRQRAELDPHAVGQSGGRHVL